MPPSPQSGNVFNGSGEAQSLTYLELQQRSQAVAVAIHEVAPPGSRVAMLFPPGLEFVVGFFGCAQAGVVPAPTCFPKPGRGMPRLDAVVQDARPHVLLADQETLAGIDSRRVHQKVNEIKWIATNQVATASSGPNVRVTRDMLGLLQYTSGSTSEPRGVMVTHGNLLANLEAIRQGFGIAWQPHDRADPETGVFWLPAFHDMGLIGGILEPLYVGGHTVLMSPRAFLARPMRWLEAISQYGATTSGAPNFAYQLCLDRATRDVPEDLDLSRWRVAFCGAEPVRAETLEGFARVFSQYGFHEKSFYPCYGLAESTLLAAGGSGPAVPQILEADRSAMAQGQVTEFTEGQNGNVARLVACGSAVVGTQLLIVDPSSNEVQADGSIGEIWLSSPSVAQGYFERIETNAQLFQAHTADGQGPFLRTGDLGAIYQGQLYVTGRLKDVIIIRGRNLYPQDIERTTTDVMGEGSGQCAAFSVAGPFGEELSIVAEAPRQSSEGELDALARKIRSAVIETHEADVRHLRLVRLASVPLTSSGKVQRSACRQAMQQGELKVRLAWDRSALEVDGEIIPSPPMPDKNDPLSIRETANQIERWILQWLIERAAVPPAEALPDRPFAEFGLDSLSSVELSSELQDWTGVELSPILAWNYPSPSKLAPQLALMMCGEAEDGSIPDSNGDDKDLESLLSEVEQLSDEEIENAFATKRPL